MPHRPCAAFPARSVCRMRQNGTGPVPDTLRLQRAEMLFEQFGQGAAGHFVDVAEAEPG